MAKSDGTDNDVVRRLDILIALTLDAAATGGIMQVADKIRRLSTIGASASEISRIIGKPLNYVTSTLSQQQKAKKGSGTRRR
jgi:hypothetical protein